MDRLIKEAFGDSKFMITEPLFKELYDYLKKEKMYIDDFNFKDNKIMGHIAYGDWKHEHHRADWLIRDFFSNKVGVVDIRHTSWTTDTDGSDCYSANHEWELYHGKAMDDYEEPLKLDLFDPDKLPVEKPEDFKVQTEDVDANSVSDANATTVEDILAGMIGNSSDSDIDRSLQIFTRIAKALGVSDYTDLQVLIHDGDYDLKSFDTLFTFDRDIYKTRDVKLFVIDERGSDAFKAVQEVLPGGSYFIYAKDMLTLDRIVQAVEKYNNGNDEEVLDETTQRQLDNREKTLYNNIRKRLGTNDLASTREQWTDAEKREYSEIRCVSMIHSILAYAYKSDYTVDHIMSNRYIKRYIDELGEDRVKVLAAEEIEEFKKATIKYAGTDSEGVSYNQVIFKESEGVGNNPAKEDSFEVYVNVEDGDDGLYIPTDWYTESKWNAMCSENEFNAHILDFNSMTNEIIPDDIRSEISDTFYPSDKDVKILVDKCPELFRYTIITEEMTDLVHDEWEQPDVDVAVFVKGEYQIKKLSDDDADKEEWEVMHFKGDTNEGTSMGKYDSLDAAKKKADDDAKKSEPKTVTEATNAGLKIYAKNIKVGDKFVSTKAAVDEYMPHKTFTITDIEDIGKDELMIKFISDEGEERDKIVDVTALIGFVPKSDITESTDGEYETRKNNYLKAKSDFEKYGEENNNDVLSREEKMNIAKAEFEKVGGSITEDHDVDAISVLDKFMNTEINDLTIDIVKPAVNYFFDEYKTLPQGMDALDPNFAEQEGEFYNKYYAFAKKCKDVVKSDAFNATGYGSGDALKIKCKELCNKVDWVFPYGWSCHAPKSNKINEEYDPKDTEFNDKYFPRVDLNDDNIHYYKLDDSEYAYDMKNAVVMFLFKDEDEVEHFGVDEAPYRVLDTVGLSRDNWNDKPERDEYLRGYKQDLDSETSYLVRDFIQNELPYYQKELSESIYSNQYAHLGKFEVDDDDDDLINSSNAVADMLSMELKCDKNSIYEIELSTNVVNNKNIINNISKLTKSFEHISNKSKWSVNFDGDAYAGKFHDVTLIIVYYYNNTDIYLYFKNKSDAAKFAADLGIKLNGDVTYNDDTPISVFSWFSCTSEKDSDGNTIASVDVSYKKNSENLSGAIVIPSTVKLLGVNATVTRIKSKVFTNYYNLQSVTIPDTVSFIAKDAFYNCNPDLIIKCSKGSYADRYAQENSIKVEYI